MKEQLSLKDSIDALSNHMHRAWSTASDFEAALCSRPSNLEIYENRLLHQTQKLYIHIAFLLEALELPVSLAELKTGYERFRNADRIKVEVDEFGNPYPLVLEFLSMHANPLMSSASDRPDELRRLERILQGTAYLVKNLKTEPSKEVDVRNVLYATLIHVFPDTVREVPIAKVSKSYRPDIGIRSLKAAVEFKFCDSEEELKRAIGGVFEDVSGYEGSEDWKNFYAVFYTTDLFMTLAQVEAEFRLSKVDRRWKPIMVHGKGTRRRA